MTSDAQNTSYPQPSESSHEGGSGPYDYSYVTTTARIALYDDLHSAPRVTEIHPGETNQYIMDIATQTYEQAKLAGGHIPFTIIKEVSENFIHARFTEVIVSILDDGNTIRFADQGPGIADKDKAQKPGFSSAVEGMKGYIRGVGSGLPIVKDYFDEMNGTITIEDNIQCGSVVTISLTKHSEKEEAGGETTDAYAEEPKGYETTYRGNDQYGQASQLAPAAQGYPQNGAGTTQAGAYAASFDSGQQGAYAVPYDPNTRGAYPVQQGGYVPQNGFPQTAGPAQQYAQQPFADGRYAGMQQPYAGQTTAMYGPATQPMQQMQPAYANGYAPNAMQRHQALVPPLNDKERQFLELMLSEGPLGVTELARLTDTANSSTFQVLKKLEEAGLVERTTNQKKRVLTEFGFEVANSL